MSQSETNFSYVEDFGPGGRQGDGDEYTGAGNSRQWGEKGGHGGKKGSGKGKGKASMGSGYLTLDTSPASSAFATSGAG